MLNELSVLENKIAQVAALCHALRAENSQLKLALSSAESEKKELALRIETARHRLEQLAQQLPETSESA